MVTSLDQVTLLRETWNTTEVFTTALAKAVKPAIATSDVTIVFMNISLQFVLPDSILRAGDKEPVCHLWLALRAKIVHSTGRSGVFPDRCRRFSRSVAPTDRGFVAT